MRVLEGQSLFDIAIQSCGSAEAAFELAVLNGVSLTDDVNVVLLVPGIIDADIAAYFAKNGLQPATALVEAAERVVFAADTVIGASEPIGNFVDVAEYQTLFDVAIQECGSIEAAYSFALLNNLSITDTMLAGVKLKGVDVIDRKIKTYYKSKGIYPATAIVDTQIENEGIDYWAIEINFIVN